MPMIHACLHTAKESSGGLQIISFGMNSSGFESVWVFLSQIQRAGQKSEIEAKN